jgi:hypothetical protein
MSRFLDFDAELRNLRDDNATVKKSSPAIKTPPQTLHANAAVWQPPSSVAPAPTSTRIHEINKRVLPDFRAEATTRFEEGPVAPSPNKPAGNNRKKNNNKKKGKKKGR